ncbi:MAG TPA: 50S ribosomal protein L19 [Thermotogota bacterium]|jgi:large subunit ribosomal protein L19|nr:50S ribosomal protein L19 [Thermotogota bacterium]NLZ14557.1 50S ribosomal protein L19 [Thermotogaceae bacterium]MDD8041612.1 50S ribosomal protein L19 [Thermotogota bacterium]MDD8053680.1 50S ribosomal protein L19 [Thermotogota bacterium]HNR63715.1 50S ribosomal protein L19 [Thermotogota bacterium]
MSNAFIRAMEQQDYKELPPFNVGDTIRISQRITEGNKERTQKFEGIVIQKRGAGLNKTFTVRKISANGIGVEKIYPYHLPTIEKIEVVKRGKVRRAKLYYIRKIVGVVKIKEKRQKSQ